MEPWFTAHLQRDIYFSLLHIDPSDQKEKKSPAIPESVLKAALLRRAAEDIRRVLALRSQKQALSMLLQRGSVGDDLWQRFLRAEKEMEEEVKDVVSEVTAPGFSVILLWWFVLLTFCDSGKCLRTGLGPDDLPIGQRNDK